MPTTAQRHLAAAMTDPDDGPPTCEHAGCMSGEPTNPGPLFAWFPDGPRRPASWGGAGAGLADPDVACPDGLEHCCGRCGCGDE